MDLQAAEPWRTQHVVLVRRQGDAAGEPGRDRERARMDRLASVGRALRRGRLRQTVAGHHAWAERVIVPALSVSIEHAHVARSHHLDVRDAIGGPAGERAGRTGLFQLPREPDVRRGDGLTVLPPRLT